MPDKLRGLTQDEAVAIIIAAGAEPDIETADPPFGAFDKSGRTPRVVLSSGSKLLVSYFRDGVPED